MLLKLLSGLVAALAATAAVKTGPAVGSPVPPFSLVDQDGKKQTLASVAGPKGTMLVFYRSADWCSVCKSQLVELQEHLADLQKQGLGLAAISYDAPNTLKSFAGQKHITFPLLSDAGSKVIRAFGILNDQVPTGTQGAGTAYPGTYIIDLKGRVKTKYFAEDSTERIMASDILVREFGAPAGGTHNKVVSKQLTLTSAVSADTVRPGQRIALTLDIELKPNMHVYAPGVEGTYIPIEWTVEGAHEVLFPPSHKLRLEAIAETVPVFSEPFRLIRDYTIPTSAKPGEIVISGSLKYQACDDHMCYFPQTVPLIWAVTVQPPESGKD